MKKMLLFLFLVATYPISLFAQGKGGTLEGRVSDTTEKPLPLVNINLPDLGRGTTSDTSGFFRIQGIPPGKHSVTFTSLGYQRITKELQIKKAETINWTIEMNEGGIQLKTLSVTSGSKAKSDFRHPLPGLPGHIQRLCTWNGKKYHPQGESPLLIFQKGSSPSA